LDTLLLILGSFLAALLSGVIGFGGALLLLPILVHATGAERAVPLLTVVQLVGNGARIWAGRREIAWEPVGAFLIPALPAAVVGALLFVALRSQGLPHLIGAMIVVVGIWQMRASPAEKRPATPAVALGGAATGLLSGIAGTAGPLGASVFLSLGLPPGKYLASEAVTALCLHVVKLIVYATAIRLVWGDTVLVLLMSVSMIVGTYCGKRLADRCPAQVFRQLALWALLLVGLKMLVFG
jgi:uncharacterized membrane protein YfcA